MKSKTATKVSMFTQKFGTVNACLIIFVHGRKGQFPERFWKSRFKCVYGMSKDKFLRIVFGMCSTFRGPDCYVTWQKIISQKTFEYFESDWFLIAAVSLSTNGYLVALLFYYSKSLNCIGTLSFFWDLFTYFRNLEKKLKWWFWSRRNRNWEKASGFAWQNLFILI